MHTFHTITLILSVLIALLLLIVGITGWAHPPTDVPSVEDTKKTAIGLTVVGGIYALSLILSFIYT